MASNRNRSEGHRYERAIVNELKELGFEDCVTSRSESRRADDDGIDIVSQMLPFHPQMKSSILRPNYHELFSKFPREDKPLVVFHKQTKKVGDKTPRFYEQGQYCIVDKDFFYQLLKAYGQRNGIIPDLPIVSNKIDLRNGAGSEERDSKE